MIAARKYVPQDLFRLAWAQTRLEFLRKKLGDINATDRKHCAERRCLELEGLDGLALREAVEKMQGTIKQELERNQ